MLGVLLSPVLAAAAMAMSSVSVATNALCLRRFQRPTHAAELLHPSVRRRVGEYAYLAGIALAAVIVGGASLVFARGSAPIQAPMQMAAAPPTTSALAIDRSIAVQATAGLAFSPNTFTVHTGETIAFDISNPTSLPPEFVIATRATRRSTSFEMATGTMHAESNFVEIAPGQAA